MKTTLKTLTLAVIAAGIAFAVTPAAANVYFRTSDTVVLRSYVPAPKETVTFYATGDLLPETVTYAELPTTVTTKLIAPPAGAFYVSAGGNVYLMERKSRRIIDAVQLY